MKNPQDPTVIASASIWAKDPTPSKEESYSQLPSSAPVRVGGFFHSAPEREYVANADNTPAPTSFF